MSKLTVNEVSDCNPRPCSNCGRSDWEEWWLAWMATVCNEPNPVQDIADQIMKEYGNNNSQSSWRPV